MNAFASALAAASATLKQFCGQSVTLGRGTSSASVTAVVGQSTFTIEDMSGPMVNIQTRDYLIVAADYLIDGSAVEPQSGDQFTEVANGVTYTYEAMSPAGEAAWRWSDRERTKYRIHTKLTDQADA